MLEKSVPKGILLGTPSDSGPAASSPATVGSIIRCRSEMMFDGRSPPDGRERLRPKERRHGFFRSATKLWSHGWSLRYPAGPTPQKTHPRDPNSDGKPLPALGAAQGASVDPSLPIPSHPFSITLPIHPNPPTHRPHPEALRHNPHLDLRLLHEEVPPTRVPRLRLLMPATLLITSHPSFPIPPNTKHTSGVKLPPSTLKTRSSYFRHFCLSCTSYLAIQSRDSEEGQAPRDPP